MRYQLHDLGPLKYALHNHHPFAAILTTRLWNSVSDQLITTSRIDFATKQHLRSTITE